MSEFTDKVKKKLTEGGYTSIVEEEIVDISFKEEMNTVLVFEFRSGKVLEIEFDWIYEFRVNEERIGHK